MPQFIAGEGKKITMVKPAGDPFLVAERESIILSSVWVQGCMRIPATYPLEKMTTQRVALHLSPYCVKQHSRMWK
uniref:Uncharacterized protein n=1 Tax=Arion vulgaris TaxID=1028688 RepID=A0A0B7B702_9EUPU